MSDPNNPPPINNQIHWAQWFWSLIFGLVLIGLYAGYLYLIESKLNLRTFNRAFAGVSTILIALSMALSGLAYFWQLFRTKIVYRKYIGIWGFVFALVHVLISLYNSGTLQGAINTLLSGRPPILFGLAALFILILMTVVSSNFAAKTLGSLWWRRLLRLGYIVLVLIAIHYYLLGNKNWLEWPQNPEGLPSTKLILLVIIVLVILLRFVLSLSLWRANHQPKAQAVPIPEDNP
jgi:methionine sulfoxide reductase heme-binding subunit